MDIPFLDYADKNPRGVIVGLLATLVAGALAGGMWVQSLRSSLDMSEKLFDSRVKLEVARLGGDVLELQRANAVLVLQASKLTKSSTALPALVDKWVTLAKDTCPVKAHSQAKEKQLKVLTEEVQLLAGELARAVAISEAAGASISVQGLARPSPSAAVSGRPPVLMFALLLGIVFAVLFLLVVRYLRRPGRPDDA